jgi:hypothetical protein
MRQPKTVAIGALVAIGMPACGNHGVPWRDERTNVIDATGNVIQLEAAYGQDCLNLRSMYCIRPQDTCDGRAAEVVLDEGGGPLAIVCYPDDDDILSVDKIEARNGNVAQNQNNSVIVLDQIADGVDILGDLSVDANNVVIYGDGADHSLLAGDVFVDGNNIIVRGVRIQGALEIVASNAVFLHCAIEGDVSIRGNNVVFSACDVLGDLQITGNNAQVSGNRVTGALNDQSEDSDCRENAAATDADEDGVLSEAEIGAPIGC